MVAELCVAWVVVFCGDFIDDNYTFVGYDSVNAFLVILRYGRIVVRRVFKEWIYIDLEWTACQLTLSTIVLPTCSLPARTRTYLPKAEAPTCWPMMFLSLLKLSLRLCHKLLSGNSLLITLGIPFSPSLDSAIL